LSRIDRVLEIALALAFVAAGTLKVFDPAAFALSLAGARLLPIFAVGAAAILLPWIEIVSGLALLLTRRYRDAATLLILGLLVLFTAGLAVELARGSTSSCGCFGPGVAFLNRPDVGLGRNLLLLAAAGALVVRRRKATSRGEPASPA
jgi:hypothetical protein